MANYRAQNELDLPDGCPEIPKHVSVDDLIAVVTLHHSDAFVANRDTVYRKLRIRDESPSTGLDEVVGCHIYLHRIVGQPTYDFGRARKTQITTQTAALDVYLPHTSVAKKQFTLAPAREAGCWRLDSASETVTIVNGVPLQKYTTRTKKKKVNVPHALYLDESKVNRVDVLGLHIDIWFIKKAVHVLNLELDFEAAPLLEGLQDVEESTQIWARSRWIFSTDVEPCSTKSYRVLQRFNGRTDTAKLFRGGRGHEKRDREMLMFFKEKTHESIVRYKASVEFYGVPAIITDTHQGMSPYGALQVDLKEKHPGLRFQVAAAILRPLFSALEFLHFHRIIHASVDWDSVLIRLEDDRVDKLLLVDYSAAYSIPPEEEMPRAAMIQDSRQAMELIEDCCSIWALRKALAPNAIDEREMRWRTEKAEQEHAMAQRTCAHYFDDKGDDRYSKYGKKLLRVLAKKEMDWSRAKTNQLHNAGQLQVSPTTKNRLQEIIHEWKRSTESIEGTKDYPMILTLGHKFLDDLANPLYHKRWDFLPRNICGELRSLEGEIGDPWQTFTVIQAFPFQSGAFQESAYAQPQVEIDGQSLTQYLAVCCDIYPEWRDAVVFEYENIIVPNGALIAQQTIGSLRAALKQNGDLPPAMENTLQQLEALADIDVGEEILIAEEHAIYYHVPSRMFNATQLHRIATLKQLNACLTDQDVRCENFAEVRGEQKLQGNYVPLSLLSKFANALGITVQDMPASERSYPIANPSDFSQISTGRIVLARKGLVAFASVPRTGNQFSHLPMSPLDIESADPFLPTYFGDMKVLPNLPNHVFDHPRPEHWAKFKTAEQVEEGAKVSKRKMLRPRGLAGKLASDTHRRLRALSLRKELPSISPGGPQISRLQTAIRERAIAIVDARTLTPRPIEEPSIENGLTHRVKRMRMLGSPVDRENLGLTASFRARNPNLMRSPPYRGFDLEQSFPPNDYSGSLSKQQKAERKLVKRWVAELSSSESEHELEDRQTEYSNMVTRKKSRAMLLLERQGSPTEPASTISDAIFQPPVQPTIQHHANLGAHWLASRGIALQQAPDSSVRERRTFSRTLPVGASAGNIGTEMPDTMVMGSEGVGVGMKTAGGLSIASKPIENDRRSKNRRSRL